MLHDIPVHVHKVLHTVELFQLGKPLSLVLVVICLERAVGIPLGGFAALAGLLALVFWRWGQRNSQTIKTSYDNDTEGEGNRYRGCPL